MTFFKVWSSLLEECVSEFFAEAMKAVTEFDEIRRESRSLVEVAGGGPLLLEDCFDGATLGEDGVLDAGALVDSGVETPDGSALGGIEFVVDDELDSLPLFLSLPNILANIPPEPENETRLVATFEIVSCWFAGFRLRMVEEGPEKEGQ